MLPQSVWLSILPGNLELEQGHKPSSALSKKLDFYFILELQNKYQHWVRLDLGYKVVLAVNSTCMHVSSSSSVLVSVNKVSVVVVVAVGVGSTEPY